MIAAAVALMVVAVHVRERTQAQQLSAELLASSTATAVLERRCAALGLANPPHVHAEVRRSQVRASASPARTLLNVKKDEMLGYRRVRLMCGDTVLSEAINWFVPGRLTPAMNAALEGSDVPFGRVILPLDPSRRTLSAWTVRPERAAMSDDVVRHRALVLDGDKRPLAVVIERYKRVLL